MVLLDRNIDMATPLHHTWTYQALVHDVLDFNLNRVVVQESEGEAGHHQQEGHRHTPAHKAKTKTCDLNPSDKFWVSYRGSPFPTVAESIQEELEDYKASESEVKRLKESMVQTFQHQYNIIDDQCIYLLYFIGVGSRWRSRDEFNFQHYSKADVSR